MTERSRCYLDYAASAPVREVALEAEAGYRAEPFACANPNSLHTDGRAAARALEQARRVLVRALGGGFRPGDLAFTGGGTEANNLGVLGMAEGSRRADGKRRRVILSAIEHDSVLDLGPALRARGFEVVLVRPDRTGVVTPEALEPLLGEDVALVAVMAANNETGAVQPIGDLARASHEAGAPLLSDAIQAFGHLALDLSSVDAVTLAAHKLGALPGTGALVLRHGTPYAPQSFGGGQERGRRAGTQDVVGAVAFAETAAWLAERLPRLASETSARARALASRLAEHPRVRLTTELPYDGASRLPGIVNLLVEGAESETLILALDDAGYEVSAGSACSSGSLDPSHVLTAMGIERDLALGSLRISFDERVGEAELDGFADAFAWVLGKRGSWA